MMKNKQETTASLPLAEGNCCGSDCCTDDNTNKSATELKELVQERYGAIARRADKNVHLLFDFALTDIVFQDKRAYGAVCRILDRGRLWRNESVFFHAVLLSASI